MPTGLHKFKTPFYMLWTTKSCHTPDARARLILSHKTCVNPGGKKEEISEEIAAKTGTQSGKEKEAMAAATKDAEGLGVGKAGTPSSTVTGGATKSETASQATKQSEKEKSKCCGCVIQ